MIVNIIDRSKEIDLFIPFLHVRVATGVGYYCWSTSELRTALLTGEVVRNLYISPFDFREFWFFK